jgi:hypothetical protein
MCAAKLQTDQLAWLSIPLPTPRLQSYGIKVGYGANTSTTTIKPGETETRKSSSCC